MDPNLCIVEHLGQHVANPPENLQVRVRVELRVPSFLDMAFIALYGSRETFVFAVSSESEADSILNLGHPAINEGASVLKHPRFIRASVVGGTRYWGSPP